jgi:cellulose synthase/poly-beta-1,6-N-acetylglucosamine synthase-like glycosyltransferase
MLNPVEAVLWLVLGGLVYVYVGYPSIVFLVSRLRPRPIAKAAWEPTVSILIAAHNEEAHIGRTIANKLALDYPRKKLQIIVVSDGSTDRTDAIAASFASAGVLCLRQEPRNGKTAAINLAVPHATGELLVFADANSLYDVAALRHLASAFADPTVGYVTGKLVYVNEDGSMTGDGCTLYMRYENVIRRSESQTGSIVGVNGGIDAVRRSLYQPMHPDDLPDLVLPLSVVARGSRVVYEPGARLSEHSHGNPRDEYRMRVRVALRALWTLADMRSMLNVRRHGFYAIQLLSHKVLRYLAWLMGVAMFVCAALLWNAGTPYRVIFLLQVGFYVCAAVGLLAERRGHSNRWLSIPYYFVLINAASLQAFVLFARGERARVWKPRLN